MWEVHVFGKMNADNESVRMFKVPYPNFNVVITYQNVFGMVSHAYLNHINVLKC